MHRTRQEMEEIAARIKAGQMGAEELAKIKAEELMMLRERLPQVVQMTTEAAEKVLDVWIEEYGGSPIILIKGVIEAAVGLLRSSPLGDEEDFEEFCKVVVSLAAQALVLHAMVCVPQEH